MNDHSMSFSIYPHAGVTLDLQPEAKVVAESAGVVEVCVSLSGELETSVNAMVFIVPGDATCENSPLALQHLYRNNTV